MNNSYLTIILVAVILCLQINVYSQNRCNSDKLMHHMHRVTPEMKNEHKEAFKAWKEKNNIYNRKMDPVTVPVHVIIVHNPSNAIGEGANLSLERIQSQIDVLNQDFGRMNADASSTPDDFDATETLISFCLANIDPNGNVTNGVTRYASDDDFGDVEFDIMEETIWDRDNYLNIYVTATITDLGYSPVPNPNWLPNQNRDAPVVLSSAFGGPGFASQPYYDLGRTATHEVGHWFGLDHVWGSNNGGCVQDDGIDDTPLQNEPNYGCPSHPSPSCSNDGDMFMNFLDYSDDVCMNAFTREQGEYMYFIIEDKRPGLFSAASTACTEVQTSAPVLTVLDVSDLDCATDANGTVVLEAEGGTAPFIYELNGMTNESGQFFGLSTGNYTATVIDANQETSSIAFQIEAPNPIIVEFVQGLLPCEGQATGSFLTVATGGTNGGYEYVLADGTNSQDGLFAGLTSGSYEVTVIDDQGCTSSATYLLDSSDGISVTEVETISPLCPGDDSGTVVITATSDGGSITTFALEAETNNTGIFEGISEGTYSYTIVDDQGCSFSSEVTLNATSDNPISIDNISIDGIDCANDISGGTVTIEASSQGSTIISYVLNGVSSTNGIFENVAIGEYEYTVLDDLGCSFSSDLQVIGSSSSPVTIDNILVQGPACSEVLASGSVVLTASSTAGNIANYQLGEFNNLNGNFTGLTPGNYPIIVTDENGCMTEGSIIVPEVPLANPIEINELNIIGTACPEDLNGGAISVTANSIAGDISSYSLNGENSESGNFNQVAAGSYELVITDENGCSLSETVEVPAGQGLIANLNAVSDISCNGLSDGFIDYDIINGTEPYAISIEGPITTDTPTDLPSGDYVVSIIDASGCLTEFDFTIAEPSPLLLEITEVNDLNCNTLGTVTAVATGGTGDILFSLNNEESSSGVFENLNSGIYTLLATDENGCVDAQSFNVNSNDELEVVFDFVVLPNCHGSNNGSVGLIVQGGTAPYSYSYGNVTSDESIITGLSAGDYTFLVSDAEGCINEISVNLPDIDPIDFDIVSLINPGCSSSDDGSIAIAANGGLAPYVYQLNEETNNTGSYTDLNEGSYTLQITDSNSCVMEFTIDLSLATPLLSGIGSIENVSCQGGNDGVIVIENSGGNPPFSFELDGVIYGDNVFEGLSPGSYEILVTDVLGCSSLAIAEVQEGPTIDLFIIDQGDAGCDNSSNGSINVEAQNGTAPYSFTLNGITNEDGSFINLPAGPATILAVDSDGCSSAIEFTIESSADFSSLAVNVNGASCFGLNDGSFEVTTNGGDPPFIYSVNGVLYDTESITELAAGTYDVIVTDEQSCASGFTVDIPGGSALALDILSIEIPGCISLESGSITLQASGGSQPYNYSNNGLSNNDGLFSNLDEGENLISVEDGNGCSIDTTIIVPAGDPFMVNAMTSNVSCFGNTDGTLNFDIVSTSDTDFTFDPDTPIGDFNMMSAGTYFITVTNADDCSVALDIVITEPDPITAIPSLTEATSSIGGTAEFQLNGGTPPFEILLNGQPTDNSGSFENLAAQDYVLTINDDAGCQQLISFTIQMSTSIADYPMLSEVVLYPNPASDFVVIENPLSEVLQMKIINTMGQVLIETVRIDKGNNQIDIGSFASGVYLLELSHGQNKSIRSLVKY